MTDSVIEQKREHLISFDLEEEIDHGILVSNLSYQIGKEIGLEDETCYDLALAGVLHDIGKLKLAGYISGKRSTLVIEEIKYVRMHSQFSYEILKNRGYSAFLLESVHYHHENYDGSGYPENLEGECIPLGARILRVCDVFCALTSKRPYRKAFDQRTAVELMIDEVKNFDMRLFLAFQRVIHK